MNAQQNKQEIIHLLELNQEYLSRVNITSLFHGTVNRFNDYSIRLNDILLDFSKNRINDETMELLLKLAKEVNLKEKIDAMFSGEKINFSEDRAVLHTALRSKNKESLIVDGEDVRPKITAELNHMQSFSDAIRNGNFKGITGQKITDVVNIGIGGSHLGPDMVCSALKAYASKDIKTHFVSNVDGADLAETLIQLNPETTLFIIASKTFTTKETLLNANSAKDWFIKTTGQEDISKNFVAISTNTEAVEKFGINTENMFQFWDWVGGRYSVWSVIGLPIAISIGMDNFYSFLDGAYEIDNHFQRTDFSKNIPVIMALIGFWHNNICGYETQAVLPYSQYLDKFATYLQQLDMESNGKRVTKEGHKAMLETGPIIFGEPGTNSQHSFYQLLHQGTKIIPADFICFKQHLRGNYIHQRILISNFIAQTEALMLGKTRNEVRHELKEKGCSDDEIERVISHKVFEGNRPTNSILIDKLTPFSLGELIVMYEHKVFVQGVLWGINSFDQWGVELGKSLALQIESELKEKEINERIHDKSTIALMKEML